MCVNASHHRIFLNTRRACIVTVHLTFANPRPVLLMPALTSVGVLTQTCSLHELSTVARAAGIAVAVWSTCTYVCIHAWMLRRAWSDPFSSHPLTFLLSFSFRERSSATFVASCSRLFSSRSCCSSMARRAACSRCRETRPEHAHIYVRTYMYMYALSLDISYLRSYILAEYLTYQQLSLLFLQHPAVLFLLCLGCLLQVQGLHVEEKWYCTYVCSMSAAVCFVCNR